VVSPSLTKKPSLSQRIERLRRLRYYGEFNYALLSGGHYDEGSIIRKFYHKKRFQKIIKELDLKKDGIIADVGCGSGNILSYLNTGHRQLIGLDLYMNFLRYAKAKVPDGHFIRCDANCPPIKNQACDLVISTEVLEHLENPGLAIKELARISKDKIFVAIPDERSAIFKVIWTIWCFIHKHEWGHVSILAPEEIRRILTKHEFTVEKQLNWYKMLILIKARKIL